MRYLGHFYRDAGRRAGIHYRLSVAGGAQATVRELPGIEADTFTRRFESESITPDAVLQLSDHATTRQIGDGSVVTYPLAGSQALPLRSRRSRPGSWHR